MGAGISFIDKASVERYKKSTLRFYKLREITAVNKIKKIRVERDASNGSCIT